jgi:hypothetical protein
VILDLTGVGAPVGLVLNGLAFAAGAGAAGIQSGAAARGAEAALEGAGASAAARAPGFFERLFLKLAKTNDDWAINSGILRDAAQGTGNFTLETVRPITAAEAKELGQA